MTPTRIAGANYGAFWPNGIGYTSLSMPPGLVGGPLLYFDVSEDGRIVTGAQVDTLRDAEGL